jgi:hypothetical protein
MYFQNLAHLGSNPKKNISFSSIQITILVFLLVTTTSFYTFATFENTLPENLNTNLSVNAQENQQGRQDLDQARGLIVFPSINELDMEKGQTATIDITLENDSQQQTYNITTVAETFEAGNQEGVPVQRPFRDDEEQRTWVTFEPSKISLEDGKKTVIKVNVAVPKTANAGSYFYSLVFSTQADSQSIDPSQPSLKIISQIGALLFLNVRGETNRQVNFDRFEINNLSPNLPGVNQVFDPFFDVVNIDYKIGVDGSFSYRPTGNMLFFNNQSKDPISSPTINPTNKIVIAGSTRSFNLTTLPPVNAPMISKIGNLQTEQETTYKIDRPWFGNQKIQANLTYKNSNDTIERRVVERQIFFFPWKTLLLVLICLSLVYGVYFGLKKLNQKKKQKGDDFSKDQTQELNQF